MENHAQDRGKCMLTEIIDRLIRFRDLGDYGLGGSVYKV